jgi:hypothetical protein
MNHFPNPRYVTDGIDGFIDPNLQIILWGLIDAKIKRKFPLDYLQIFDIIPVTNGGKKFLRIIHRQNHPRFQKVHLIPSRSSFVGKVWVIDEKEYSAMLFPDEF